MLIIDTLPLGDYQTNCYIVRREDSRKALILDTDQLMNTPRH